MTGKFMPPLRPLALMLAAAFPLIGNATPSVSASGSYRVDPDPFAPPWQPPADPQVGSFNQAASSGAFDRSLSNIPDYPAAPYWADAVNLRAYSNGSGSFGASIENKLAMFSPQRAQSQVALTDTIFNSTGRAQNVTFGININTLKFFYNTGIIGSGLADWGSGTNAASFSAQVLVNGRSVWSSSFSAEPMSNGIHWTASGANIGLGGAASATICSDFNECGFSIFGYHNLLNLGPLAARSSMTVSYIVDLATETDTYGGAPSIYFGDPAELSGSPDVLPSASLQFAAPVPEPEEASMMAVGLAMLGAMGARRRRKHR